MDHSLLPSLHHPQAASFTVTRPSRAEDTGKTSTPTDTRHQTPEDASTIHQIPRGTRTRHREDEAATSSSPVQSSHQCLLPNGRQQRVTEHLHAPTNASLCAPRHPPPQRQLSRASQSSQVCIPMRCRDDPTVYSLPLHPQLFPVSCWRPPRQHTNLPSSVPWPSPGYPRQTPFVHGPFAHPLLTPDPPSWVLALSCSGPLSFLRQGPSH